MIQQWIYAICNAIESVIQGTSSVRTFDTSKLRTISGAYDDHAVPLRQKLGFPVPGIPPRGGGMPSIPGSPSRRSMPPSSRVDEGGPGQFENKPRKRQTSFKKALRQSAEIAGEKWKDAIGPRYPVGSGYLSPGNRIKSSSSQSGLSVSSGGWRTDSPLHYLLMMVPMRLPWSPVRPLKLLVKPPWMILGIQMERSRNGSWRWLD